MRTDPSNPTSNVIPNGIKEPALLKAIEASGYPLQGVAAGAMIRHGFEVVEEWGYIDRDSKEHRSLDVAGWKDLAAKTARVCPRLCVLAECKRSAFPHIFFQSVANRPIPGFPTVGSVPRGYVPLEEQVRRAMLEARPGDVLGLAQHPFSEPGPPKCAAFSRATPSGDKVSLSGDEIFHGLVLPLVKAFDHYRQLFRAGPTDEVLFPTLLINVGVLDSPMVLVESPDRASDPILTPWVRVVRQEAQPDHNDRIRFNWYAIDAVHMGFFETYLTKHLLPLADEFAQRAVRQENVLRHGGTVDSLDAWEWDKVRAKPAPQR
jgi:hypothetical protein